MRTDECLEGPGGPLKSRFLDLWPMIIIFNFFSRLTSPLRKPAASSASNDSDGTNDHKLRLWSIPSQHLWRNILDPFYTRRAALTSTQTLPQTSARFITPFMIFRGKFINLSNRSAKQLLYTYSTASFINHVFSGEAFEYLTGNTGSNLFKSHITRTIRRTFF